MDRRSFLSGAALLAASGLIAKVIGAAFRIPLTYVIGSEGMGLYQMAHPIYAFLLVASTAGMPVAISKMVSERVAQNDRRGAQRIFAVALKILFWMGLLNSIVLLLGSAGMAALIGNPLAVYSLMAIAPAIFFVSVMSAFRGYFQGLQIMAPTALSQLVEQTGRLVLGLLLAWLWMGYGVEYGAAGGILGVTLSSILALVLLVRMYKSHRRDIRDNPKAFNKASYRKSNKGIASDIIRIALPVTLGASVMPLVNLVDKLIVVNRLTGAYYTVAEATSLYGLLTAYSNPIANLPSIFTVALAMSLVPAISESNAGKDRVGIIKKAVAGIRITILISMPAMVGMAVLAQPIVGFLYRALPANELVQAGNILRVSALGIVFLAMIQSLTAILQGLNRVTAPVYNLIIGAVFKLIITFILVGIPGINVIGAAIGTVVCYGVAAILNFITVRKAIRLTSRLRDILLRPAIAAGAMGFSVYLVFNAALEKMQDPNNSLLIAMLAGAAIYAVALLLVGALKKEDFEVIPATRRLGRLLSKLGVLK